jgi:hypothetical protein
MTCCETIRLRQPTHNLRLLSNSDALGIVAPIGGTVRLRQIVHNLRWLRRVEEALIEMYLAGVSVRRVEDITEALVGAR